MNVDVERNWDEFSYAAVRFIEALEDGDVPRSNSERLLSALHQVMRDMKGPELISRSRLSTIYTTLRAARDASMRTGAADQALERVADRIEYCFALMLNNEAPEDRRPGVPRII